VCLVEHRHQFGTQLRIGQIPDQTTQADAFTPGLVKTVQRDNSDDEMRSKASEKERVVVSQNPKIFGSIAGLRVDPPDAVIQ
jgi:hypothetical protein